MNLPDKGDWKPGLYQIVVFVRTPDGNQLLACIDDANPGQAIVRDAIQAIDRIRTDVVPTDLVAYAKHGPAITAAAYAEPRRLSCLCGWTSTGQNPDTDLSEHLARVRYSAKDAVPTSLQGAQAVAEAECARRGHVITPLSPCCNRCGNKP